VITTSPVGEVLHELRERRITHLPVVEDSSAVGVVSLHDLVRSTTREASRQRGGAPSGFDEHGGEGSSEGYRPHDGYGARAERERLLDLPVADVMTDSVATAAGNDPLDEAVDRMFDRGASSLVIVDDDGRPVGIVTKTDVLTALTWARPERRPVQVYGVDLVDDVTYDEVAATTWRGNTPT
jgi:CBS domain-containing protein